MAINLAVIMGRLTADPEVRETKKDHLVASFTVAVDRNYTDDDGNRQADFIRCVAWNSAAEFIEKWFGKGSMIAVTGRLQSGTYEDDNGSTHYTTDLIVEQVSFTGEKIEKDDKGSSSRAGKSSGGKSSGGKSSSRSRSRR